MLDWWEAASSSAIGPLSTAVTISPSRTSCQVQPPGAAPRSTASNPARSSSWRSSGERKVISASSSLRAERLGACLESFKRGMPIGRGAACPGCDQPGITVVESVNVR